MNTNGYGKKQLAWFCFKFTCMQEKTNSGLERLKAQTHQTYVKGQLLSLSLSHKSCTSKIPDCGCIQKCKLAAFAFHFTNTRTQTELLHSYLHFRIGTVRRCAVNRSKNETCTSVFLLIMGYIKIVGP